MRRMKLNRGGDGDLTIGQHLTGHTLTNSFVMLDLSDV